MQIIVYHSKARKTMCGMGTFCLIGMISLQLTIQNGEMKQDSFNLENKPVEQTDLNAIYSGVHRYSNLSKNIPSAYNGYIIVMKRGGGTLGQIALDDSGTLYSRVCNDLSWGSWK